MKTAVLTLFLLSFSFFNFSQIDIDVSKQNVSVYESFTLFIKSDANCDLIQQEIKGFELIGPPEESIRSSTTSINGHITKSKSITRTYVLKCKKSGTYKIGPFKMNCEGEIVQSNSITITVSDSPSKNPEFYTELYCNKQSVYPGEPFILVQKLFLKTKAKTQLEQITPSVQPNIKKFDITPFDEKGNIENKYETINGVDYNTAIIRQEICFLNEIGDIVIEPYYTSALTGSGFFDTKRIEAFSNIVKLNSKQKSNSKPTNDFGLTGHFELNYKLDETTLKAGEALDLTITLQGSGNFQLFNTPLLKVPESFDVFEPELNESLQINENGFFGEKSYHFTYVPNEIGDFIIAAFVIDYFDLKTKTYKQISIPELKIHVEKGENGYGEIIHESTADTTSNKFEIKDLHNPDNTTLNKKDILAGGFLHFTLLLFPFGLLWLYLKLKKNKNSLTDEDKIIKKQKKAKKSSKQHLAESKKLHKNNDDKAALISLDLAFRNFLKQKLNLTENDLTLNNVHSKIENAQIQSTFISCWNTIELYKYAPINPAAISDLITQTESLINEIDKQL